ncbi:spondin domain-containing protein [Ectothiorhodospiraceae bacterium WFHF3C12]|nr:spondin domain-containing protein [Ectothiorhodospiraceae bacterium WFHF3C12]
MRIRNLLIALALLAFFPAALAAPFFGHERDYDVTITNVTHGVSFTPFLVVSHSRDIALFELGAPASPELALLAEGGATGPLATQLGGDARVHDIQTSAGLLGPGQSVTVRISTRFGFRRISLAAMLLPTNDSFVAVDGIYAPLSPYGRATSAPGYDAGSEPNDELCVNIPGPTCGGAGASPEAGGEGFMHISRGIQGVGDLMPGDYDWRNPVAHISIVPASD